MYDWRRGNILNLEVIRIFQIFTLCMILARYKIKTSVGPPLLPIKPPHKTPPLTNLRGRGGPDHRSPPLNPRTGLTSNTRKIMSVKVHLKQGKISTMKRAHSGLGCLSFFEAYRIYCTNVFTEFHTDFENKNITKNFNIITSWINENCEHIFKASFYIMNSDQLFSLSWWTAGMVTARYDHTVQWIG